LSQHIICYVVKIALPPRQLRFGTARNQLITANVYKMNCTGCFTVNKLICVVRTAERLFIHGYNLDNV